MMAMALSDETRAWLAVLDRVRTVVKAKVPAADVDDIIGDVAESWATADRSAVEDLAAFAVTIAQRRVADYHRQRERSERPESAASPVGALYNDRASLRAATLDIVLAEYEQRTGETWSKDRAASFGVESDRDAERMLNRRVRKALASLRAARDVRREIAGTGGTEAEMRLCHVVDRFSDVNIPDVDDQDVMTTREAVVFMVLGYPGGSPPVAIRPPYLPPIDGRPRTLALASLLLGALDERIDDLDFDDEDGKAADGVSPGEIISCEREAIVRAIKALGHVPIEENHQSEVAGRLRGHEQ
jgi:DNA-directed RNA polymerase specialized sigma24 family protein